MKGKFIVIAGPSASGKTALVKELVTRIPKAARLITTTTREKRVQEKDGVDYFFITKEVFEQGIARGDFFEYAEVYGNWYGSSKTVLDTFRNKYNYVFAIIDVQGARTLKSKIPDAFLVFIKPGSLDEIKKRLSLERKEVSSQEIEKRIQTAEHELAVAGEFDAVIENTEGEFDKTIFTIIDVLK